MDKLTLLAHLNNEFNSLVLINRKKFHRINQSLIGRHDLRIVSLAVEF